MTETIHPVNLGIFLIVFRQNYRIFMKNFIIVSFLFFIFHFSAIAQFGGGDGLTPQTAFEIYTKAHLEELSDTLYNAPLHNNNTPADYDASTNWTYGKYFKLMNDITDPVINTIGPYAGALRPFQGCFDGQDFVVELAINSFNNGALFGALHKGTIKNVRVTGYTRGSGIVQRIEGNSKIINCHNSAFIINGNAGIVSNVQDSGRVENCSNIGTIKYNLPNSSSQIIMGGIVAGSTFGNGNIINNFNSGYIQLTINSPSQPIDARIGGIIGSNFGDTLSNNINVGVVISGAGTGGGIIGNANSGATVTNCFYDNQMCVYDNGAGTGLLTTSMLGDALKPYLDTNIWQFNDGLYPVLKSIADHPIGKVGRSPVYLTETFPDDWDKHNKVRSNFTISTANAVNWSNTDDKVSISGSNATLVQCAGWDTLIAEINGHKREVPIQVLTYYNLALKASPTTVGTVIGAGKHLSCSAVEFETILLDTCYRFVNWTDSATNAVVSTKLKDKINLMTNRTLIANFERISYTVTTGINIAEAGTVSGSGDYDLCNDNPVIIEAIENDCYTFLHWTDIYGNIISTNLKDTIFMKRDSSSINSTDTIFIYSHSLFIAHFQQDSFDLVTLSAFNVPSTATGTGRYACRDRAIIEAKTLFSCYKFLHWIDTLTKQIFSTKQIDTILMTEDLVLRAVFYSDTTFTISLNVNPENAGFAFGGGVFGCRDEVRIRAYPEECYRFLNWTNNDGTVFSPLSSISILALQDLELTANFAKISSYEVRLSAIPEEGGTVSGGGEYSCGDTAKISATANEDYRFVYWRNLKNNSVFSTASAVEFLVFANFDLEAIFVDKDANICLVNLRAEPQTAGTVTGSGIYEPNTVATISATATNECYDFKHWLNSSGDVVSTENPYEITVISDTLLRAIFEIKRFELMLEASPTFGGTVFGAGTFDCNETVTITAVANTGFDFQHWRDLAGNIISEESDFELTVQSDTVLTAVFRQGSGFLVVITQNPSWMGTTTGVGTGLYPMDFAGTTTAIPSADIYKFVYWSNNNFEDTLSKNAEFNFVIISDTTFVAHFEFDNSISENIKTETVNIIPNPTKDNFEISFDVIKSGNIAISLLDLTGGKVFEIYNDFTVEGTFSKTVKTNNLARGVYYLKIEIDKNHFKIERIIFE